MTREQASIINALLEAYVTPNDVEDAADEYGIEFDDVVDAAEALAELARETPFITEEDRP